MLGFIILVTISRLGLYWLDYISYYYQTEVVLVCSTKDRSPLLDLLGFVSIFLI